MSTLDKISIDRAVYNLIKYFLHSERKRYYLTPNIFFVYEDTSFLFCETVSEKIDLSYEERDALIYLIKNQDLTMSVKHLEMYLEENGNSFKERRTTEKIIIESLIRKLGVIERHENEKNIVVSNDCILRS